MLIWKHERKNKNSGKYSRRDREFKFSQLDFHSYIFS
jgi:hypothetical protein